MYSQCSLGTDFSLFLFKILTTKDLKNKGGYLYPFIASLLPMSGYSSGFAGFVPKPSTYLLYIQNAAAIKTVSCISSSLAPAFFAASISFSETAFPLF
jgi:hypothetical protein